MSTVDNDARYLARLLNNRQRQWPQVQDDLETIYNELQQQMRVALVNHSQWTHLSSDENFLLATPASKVLDTVKLLKGALSVREEIARLGTRYVVTNLLYRNATRGLPISQSDLDGKAERVIHLMDEQTQKLNADIFQMEKELHTAEKDLRTGPCSSNSEHVNALFRRAFDTLTANEKDKSEQRFQELLEKIEAQARELASLKQQIEEKDRIEKVEQPEPVDVAIAEDNPVRVDLNDVVYWERMVEEVREPEEDAPPPALVSDESDEDEEDDDLDLRSVADEEEDEAAVIEQEMIAQEEAREIELRRRVEDLQNWVDRMRRDLRDFPFRKKEIQSPGMCPKLKCAFCEAEGEHFSDSCPIVTNGDERYSIIRDLSACYKCLEYCPAMWPDDEQDDQQKRKECPYKDKDCYYCKRLQGTTFEDLIPDDGGHHTALCNIPQKKLLARVRFEREEDELRELLGELARLTARRNARR
ncbi:unnamed protein product [Heligmosomoides polygyrus]|uniref:CCHC-type domain-containing protein n=1 Tax=Heligmosomoides polygyrus TaxID=6339 RepID=A0A183GIT9_HELPZ|nr:unnamed protein product [Heligmosomoides polygyrus]